MKYIAYLRVSTVKQGQSGLGLDAQKDAVSRFAKDGEVIGEFVEVESGRKDARPELAGAMAKCRETGATLLIAKLDRLARDVAFIATLMKSDVKFVAADMPTADPFRLHIEAAIAEEEARKISARTKSALAMARARGVTLGGYRGYVPDPVAAGLGAERSRVARQAKSRARAIAILPVLEELRSAGVVSVSGLAVALNARSIPAPRGGSWQAVQVARVLSQGT